MPGSVSPGSFVHSHDKRDDPETFYVVVETDVHTSSGLAHKIALPEEPEQTFYRLVWLLSSADAEVKHHVAEAERHAADIREGR